HGAPASAELNRQIEAVRQATERYREHGNAVADGYLLFGAEGRLMGEHWYHPDLVRKQLDLTHPATLQYATVDGRRVLVGVAYNVYQRPGEALPDGFAGSDDHWHVHDMPKLARALAEERPFLRWVIDRRAEQGKIGAGDHRSQLVMVHAWVWSDNPDGMFAQQHRALPYVRAGLPAEWAARADAEAAWGVSLLRAGCQHELARLNRLARLSADQQQQLSSACADAAAAVRRAAADARSADALNGAARRAWLTFSKQRDGLLTPEQKRRLASVIEPMHATH
ncbi:MAG: hypothetical protein ACRENP_30000, partial [Longimicrobiales bacterium]